MMKRTNILLAIVLALTLAAASCSDGDDGDDGDIGSGVGSTDSTLDGATTTDTTSPDDSTTSTTDDDGSTTSTTDDSGSTTSTTTADTDLPGEPWDGFAQAGDTLSVFGVEADDELNVRAEPGTDADIVATAAPTADDLVATGRARQLTRSFWYEVNVDGVTGWVAVAFVAYEGGTDDATAEYLADDGPTGAETMLDLGRLVATEFASVDPASDVVESVAPTVGDLGEVTFDVVGIGDDAGAGYRIHVFAEEDASGEGFTLRTIERTSYCTRGVTGELCN